MEETTKIRNVKEKIRNLITHTEEEIQKKMEEKHKNSEKIKQLDLKVESLNIEIERMKVKQIEHYYSILQFGLDTRQEGLKWVIKALWTLGENLKISRFPTFLDAKSIEYILEYSKLDTKLNEYLETSKELKSSIFKQQKIHMRNNSQFFINDENKGLLGEMRQKVSSNRIKVRKSSMPAGLPGTMQNANPYLLIESTNTNKSNPMSQFKSKEVLMSNIKEKLQQIRKSNV